MDRTVPPGPVMLDLAGTQLTDEERGMLCHPLVGAVILFARNFESVAQVRDLTAEVRRLRPFLLIAVDHEGGRVQRFRNGLTRIPPMRSFGEMWDCDAAQACRAAEAAGLVLALELRACGVDFSFTPVLDLDYGKSAVIGDRAFHRDPLAVAALASSLVSGLRQAGMASVGKHFPGHGFVAEDSHHEVPVDRRGLDALSPDLLPYREHRRIGLAAVMPAHIVYERLDAQPAGFSAFWLRDVLRGELGFDGAIFSDDLCMEAACVAGDIVERARVALAAGCDMVLVCNNPVAARRLLVQWQPAADPRRTGRIASLRATGTASPMESLAELPEYQAGRRLLESIPRFQ